MTRLIGSILTLARKGGALLLVLAAMSGVASATGDMGAPELDPGSMASALALMGGGLVMLMDRRRRK